jgi:hypothetical protein
MTSMKSALAALSAGAAVLCLAPLSGCGNTQESGASQSSAALNYNGGGNGSGNKALNLSGYEYVDSTHIIIYFNHQSSTSGEIDASMFQVKPMQGSTNYVSSVSAESGNSHSGTDAVNLTKGTKVTVTLGTALSADTAYKVMINGTLANDNGLTIGNYTYREGFEFVMRTPVSCSGTPVTCSWSSAAPVVKYEINSADAGGVPYENNLVIVFDRPLLASALPDFLDALSANFIKDYADPVVQDDDNTTGHDPVDGGECYTPKSNNVATNAWGANTTFYFPMFLNGTKDSNNNAFAVYNRDDSGSHHYELTLPSFTDISNHTFSNPGTKEFDTLSADLPGWLDGRPTVTAGASQGLLDVSWSATTLDSNKIGPTTGYSVYYVTATSSTDTTNKWAGAYTSFGCSTSGSPPATSCTISGLSPSTYYYVRVIPTNSVGGAGFSRSNVNAVQPHQ